MRKRSLALAAAWLAALSVAGAETGDLQPVQGPQSAAGAPAPATPEAALAQDAPETGVAEAGPATASSAAEAAGAAGAEAIPAPADPAAPHDAPTSQAVTLKMATVPPPADFKVPAGYRPVKRGLETVYCTSITPIGSRMPKTYCMTRDQVEQIQRQAELDRQMLKEKARTGGTSGG